VLSSITEMDTVSSTTIGTAAVFTTVGVATGDTITDNSSNTLTVPTGTGRVGIVAIDGVGVTPGTEPEVTPGETVTYSITRTLSTGDYASLNLTAYLPLPVFDVADPLSNGGNVSSFTQAGIIGESTFLPAAGEYTYFVTWAGAGAPAYVVQSANVGTTANDITFSLGSRDDTTNAHNQTVTIYFTVTASSAPFADGLLLTAQGQTVLTNGSGTVATTENIGQIKVDEPNLVDSIKVGIASLVNNSGVAQSTGFTVDGVGTTADPTGYYAAAGKSGDLFVGAGNTGPGTTPIGGLQDLNVSGADASNTVRIVETIGNAGAAGAYDVVVSDLLPAGYTVSDVNLASLTVVQSGTLIQLVPQAGETLADLFTAGGVTLENPNSTSANPIPTLNATGQTGSVMTIAFDMTLHSNQSAGAVLIDTGNILNYTNIYNGVANNNGFVVDGNPVGGSKANLVDTATITTAAIVPTLYFTAEANGTTSVSPGDTANIAMTVGDIARLHGVAEIPSGTNSDVVLDFALPAGFVYTADNTLTLALVSPNGSFTSTTLDLSAAGLQVDSAAVANVVTYAPSYLAAADATVVNGHLQINLGTLSNNNGSDAPNYAIVEFNAQVANVAANTANQRLIDNFGVQANGSEIAANPLTETVVEPNVTLAKTVTVNPATDSATYVITLHNNSGITAYNVDVTDPYPASNVLSVSTVAPGGLDPSHV
jgi:uncharacterized repeat protein (TIGR01451 family)